MKARLSPLLRGDSLNGDALAVSDIERIERAIGIALPADFVQFLLVGDGYGGPVGNTGNDVYLWTGDEIIAGGYDGPRDAGVVLIGSNGGSTGFGIINADRTRFVSIPLASDDLDEIRELGGTFEEFLRAIADGEGW
ncbi:SMI1/KNR4 family protein [Microbacterium sp. 22179]|uniref:SMI1/KNR4 family protein n=1 Tax=Microbacterium sp. 22179 TaxID=3453886 RepID=UPI003F848311